ncbi:hypothetical protein EYF80_046524 [Liparis tanakae]|uniref:Uncharacterized protein n=1 Tax=Liparis tanakae TaxID=230148 RepID=A0A4Z2FRG7_9TELE|nr:hypothetical protein EYF80_046524 [Liparis tanakae]
MNLQRGSERPAAAAALSYRRRPPPSSPPVIGLASHSFPIRALTWISGRILMVRRTQLPPDVEQVRQQ